MSSMLLRIRVRQRAAPSVTFSESRLPGFAALILLLFAFQASADFTVPCDKELLNENIDAGRPRSGGAWQRQYESHVEKAESSSRVNIAVYGDSITEDLAEMGDALEVYRRDYKMEAFGIGGDTSFNLLWRMQNGEFSKDMSPQFAVVHIGINNILSTFEDEGDLNSDEEDEVAERIEDDVRDIVALIQKKSCRTQVMIQAVLPTAWETDNQWPNRYTGTIDKANRLLSRMAESYSNTHFMDCSNIFLEGSESRRRIRTNRMDDLLHPTEEGHKALAKCVLEYSHKAFQEIMEKSTSLVFHKWGDCSAPCGGGYHIRDSDCKLETDFIVGVDSEVSQRVGREACNRIPVNGRDLVQACNTDACPTIPPPPPSTSEPQESILAWGDNEREGEDNKGKVSPATVATEERPTPPTISPPTASQLKQRTPSLADWFSMLSANPPAFDDAVPSIVEDADAPKDSGESEIAKAPAQGVSWSHTPSDIKSSLRTSRLVDLTFSQGGGERFEDAGAEVPEFVIIAIVAICTCVVVTLCGGATAYVCYVRKLSQERQRLLEECMKNGDNDKQTKAVERETVAHAQHNLKWRRVTEETAVMAQIMGAHQGV